MNGSNWNANSGENNVLNASGVALVKKVVGRLKKLDEPETHLSETTLTATNASVKGRRPGQRFCDVQSSGREYSNGHNSGWNYTRK